MDVTPDRRALRAAAREARRAVPPAARLGAAAALAEALLAFPLREGARVAGYWASDGELPLHAWQLRLPAHVRYCLPVLGDDARLRFAPWTTGGALEPNRYGIPEPSGDVLFEPADMDLVAVPLVAFDRACHRLGMGGGWYDRSFAFRQQRPAPPLLVGAAFDFQAVDDLLPVEAWDVALDAVCTERATYRPAAGST
jgi:5-formyltetrahydrofolate cyclo-ligase